MNSKWFPFNATCISAIKSHEKQNHCSQASLRDEETNGERYFWVTNLHYCRCCEADKTRNAENGNNWGNSSCSGRIGNALVAEFLAFFSTINRWCHFLKNTKCQPWRRFRFFVPKRLRISRNQTDFFNSPDVDLMELIKCSFHVFRLSMHFALIREFSLPFPRA